MTPRYYLVVCREVEGAVVLSFAWNNDCNLVICLWLGSVYCRASKPSLQMQDQHRQDLSGVVDHILVEPCENTISLRTN